MQEITDKVNECLQIAEKFFNRPVPKPKVRFDLRGRVAGQAFYFKHWLRFNTVLFQENREDFLNQTVPHEVAHWIQDWLYGVGKTKPHGREWKGIMKTVFGLSPERCHSYNVENARTRTLPAAYKYKCSCTTHHLTIVRHRRIQNGQRYKCRKCGSFLEKA